MIIRVTQDSPDVVTIRGHLHDSDGDEFLKPFMVLRRTFSKWAILDQQPFTSFCKARDQLALCNAMYAKADQITENGLPSEQANEPA